MAADRDWPSGTDEKGGQKTRILLSMHAIGIAHRKRTWPNARGVAYPLLTRRPPSAFTLSLRQLAPVCRRGRGSLLVLAHGCSPIARPTARLSVAHFAHCALWLLGLDISCGR